MKLHEYGIPTQIIIPILKNKVKTIIINHATIVVRILKERKLINVVLKFISINIYIIIMKVFKITKQK